MHAQNLCALSSQRVFLTGPLIFGTKMGTLKLNMLPHIMVDVGGLHVATLPILFNVSS